MFKIKYTINNNIFTLYLIFFWIIVIITTITIAAAVIPAILILILISKIATNKKRRLRNPSINQAQHVIVYPKSHLGPMMNKIKWMLWLILVTATATTATITTTTAKMILSFIRKENLINITLISLNKQISWGNIRMESWFNNMHI